jgi:hypothetical protein
MRIDLALGRVGFPSLPPMVSRFVVVRFANSGSAANIPKARLHPTEQPNVLPTSWHCPGQHKGVVW